ncbi:hypothetical protein RhiJN_26420 [Ceratobasidium sp. AG-Ba]|nr:hypothetical protein RhiJN_26420 [Ceratobasidium sp. AG-Ba]
MNFVAATVIVVVFAITFINFQLAAVGHLVCELNLDATICCSLLFISFRLSQLGGISVLTHKYYNSLNPRSPRSGFYALSRSSRTTPSHL